MMNFWPAQRCELYKCSDQEMCKWGTRKQSNYNIHISHIWEEVRIQKHNKLLNLTPTIPHDFLFWTTVSSILFTFLAKKEHTNSFYPFYDDLRNGWWLKWKFMAFLIKSWDSHPTGQCFLPNLALSIACKCVWNCCIFIACDFLT